MPTLILENVPPDMCERLRQLLPDVPFMTAEGPPPCELPRPNGGIPITAREGRTRIPDPLTAPIDPS